MQKISNGKVLDMRLFIPTKTLTGQTLYSKVNNNQITIWTKPEKGGKSSKARIKRFVKPGIEFWVGLGLFLAERTGLGNRKQDMGRVAVTNSNPQIINVVLRVFEKLGIKRASWRGIISANSFYLQSSETFSKRARKYWASTVNIPFEKISVALYNRKPRRRRETTPFGTLQVRLESVVINTVIQSLTSNILGHKTILKSAPVV